MITDPHEALAEQNQVVAALVGLAALGRAVRALAAGARHPTPRAADGVVHLLLAVAHLGDAVERLVPPAAAPASDGAAPPATPRELLR
jgi:hypothetical protein